MTEPLDEFFEFGSYKTVKFKGTNIFILPDGRSFVLMPELAGITIRDQKFLRFTAQVCGFASISAAKKHVLSIEKRRKIAID